MTARVRRLCVTVISALALASGLLVLPALAAAATPGYLGVDFISDNAGWVVGTDTTVLATANGGKVWQTQATTPGGAALLDVCVLPDGKTGWAVGASGTVLRTTDGKAWAKVFSPAFDKSLQLHVGQVRRREDRLDRRRRGGRSSAGHAQRRRPRDDGRRRDVAGRRRVQRVVPGRARGRERHERRVRRHPACAHRPAGSTPRP